MTRKLSIVLLLIIVATSCKKEKIIIPDNDAPYYSGVSTVLIENYVNRSFIDLLGREPLNTEMEEYVEALKEGVLSDSVREDFLSTLQFNTDFVEGDSSYMHAYFHRIYEMVKVRMVEGAADGEFSRLIGLARNSFVVDSLNGDTLGMDMATARILRLQKCLDSKREYFLGEIELDEMHRRLMDNGVYDVINMNTFNFVNASFDDCFSRFPTEEEFYNSFDMIEYNLSRMIFNRSGANKEDFVTIMTGTREFWEGIVRWQYVTMLAREPSTDELFDQMSIFFEDHDVQRLQRSIMVTDEYANFRQDQ